MLIAEAVDGFVKRVNFSLCLNASKFDCVFSFFFNCCDDAGTKSMKWLR